MISANASLCKIQSMNQQVVEPNVKTPATRSEHRSGLRILAFPCNQFGHQEPGDAEEIQCFVKDRKVNFDLFEKIDVNGGDAHPLYKYLKKQQGGTLIDAIKWNFTKFIIDKNGKPVERFAPTTSPKEMLKTLEKYLDTKNEL